MFEKLEVSIILWEVLVWLHSRKVDLNVSFNILVLNLYLFLTYFTLYKLNMFKILINNLM